MHGEYHGTQEQVLAQMADEHKKSRQDMLNRKICARQRKEEIEARQEEMETHGGKK